MKHTEQSFDLGPVGAPAHHTTHTRTVDLPAGHGAVTVSAVLEGDSEGEPELIAFDGPSELGSVRGLQQPLELTVPSPRPLKFQAGMTGASSRLTLNVRLTAQDAAGASADYSVAPGSGVGWNAAGTPGQVVTFTVLVKDAGHFRLYKYGIGGVLQEPMRLLDAGGQQVARTPVDGEPINGGDSTWGLSADVTPGQAYTVEITMGQEAGISGQMEAFNNT
ncbi:hypothetical protein [Deinococcus cavernae]|uniref:hypothetical protein n=1 Tax=Deinococcus cavernae TaxID=2320857 RepID=UPI0011C23C80|nr:hypothetical protein [Deinococcus cavernae]